MILRIYRVEYFGLEKKSVGKGEKMVLGVGLI
jgi:hypothetical protein